MIVLAFVLVSLAAAAGLFLWFCHLERQGRAVSVVLFVWAVLVVDASIYPGFDSPPGLLHPTFGDFSFRLPEIIIPLALAARVAVRGLPRRIGTGLLWWVAFTFWYLFQAGMGVLSGHSVELILFEAKIIVYLGGGLALAAGVPAAEYIGSRGLPRLIKGASVAALVLLVMDQLEVKVAAELPLFPLERFGEMGADAATIFAVLGVVGLALAACTTERQGLLLAASPLLICPLSTEQRASLVALVVSFVVLAVGWWIDRGRQRFTITPTDVALFSVGLLALLLVPSFGRVTSERAPSINPFAEELRSSFTSRGKTQSAQSRENQWEKAAQLVQERPVLGWGLGREYWHFEEGPDEFWKTNITHNIGLDLLMRSGVVGLGLFLLAVGTPLMNAPRTWRLHPDPRVAALALACAAAAIGIFARGMVESILEEYRLATAFGLVLGTLRAATTSLGSVRVDPLAQPRVVEAKELHQPWN